MTVKHAEIGHNNWDRQRNDQDTGPRAKRSDDQPSIGFGHHVSVAHCGHGDHGPPQPLWNALEVIGRVGMESLGVIHQRGEDDHAQDQEEDQQG